jgi:hypothetical protein
MTAQVDEPDDYCPTRINRVELPEQMLGRLCHEEDKDTETQEFFSFPPRCDGATVYFWEAGYSGPGRGYCEFEKVEKIASDLYLVRANCKGQSGIKGFLTENFELEIINGYLVKTDIPEGRPCRRCPTLAAERPPAQYRTFVAPTVARQQGI